MRTRSHLLMFAAYGALLAIPIGLALASTYDDDHDRASNVLLPVGLIMAATGAALLAILALVGLAAVAVRAARRGSGRPPPS